MQIVMGMAGGVGSQIQQTPQQQQQQQQQAQLNETRTVSPNIWQGILEWNEKKMMPDGRSSLRKIPCKISSQANNGILEVKTDDWPATLQMLVVQKSLLSSVGNAYFQRTHKVMFYPDQCPALESLTASLSQGYAGCIHLSSSSTEVKMIILLYAADRKVFVGVIPLDQVAFVTKMNQVFQNQPRNMQQSQALTKQNDSSLNHEQVAEKWNNFVQAYNKYHQNMKTTGAAPQKLPESFAEIEAILGEQQSVQPKYTTSVDLKDLMAETANTLLEVPIKDEIVSVKSENIVQPSTSHSNIEVVAPPTKRRRLPPPSRAESADKTMKEMLTLNEKFLKVEKEKVNLIKSNLKRESEEEIETPKILGEESSSHKLLISLIQNQNEKLNKLEILLKSLDGRLQNIEKFLNL